MHLEFTIKEKLINTSTKCGTYLCAVLTRILSQFPVCDRSVPQERWPIAVAARTQVASVRVFGVVMRDHQVVVQSEEGDK